MSVSAVPSTLANPGSGAAAAAELHIALHVGCASARLILDMEEIDRDDRSMDLIGSLILTAIVAANVSLVTRDPALQKAYSALDEPAPEALLRPVSISAVAHSLRMPFETVRRRVRGMVRSGMVADVPGGVMVSVTTMFPGAFLKGMVRRHDRLAEFYREMKVIGALPPADPDAPAPPPEAAPIRISNRAMWQYLLRAVDDLMNVAGDVLKALVFLGIVRANIADLPSEDLSAWSRSPLSYARPVRTSPLAARLNLSPESCRRYAIALEEMGLCRRTRRGLVACIPAQKLPAVQRSLATNLANVQRLFATLRQLGALEAWDMAPPRAMAASA